MPTTERWRAWLVLALMALLSVLRRRPCMRRRPGRQPRRALRVGVMTMQPGEIFWERFGHDAIVIVDPHSGQATSYNYGYFDLDEPGFTGRFVRGTMQYMLAALPLEQDLAIYRDEGRGVSIQWLDLTPAQARAAATPTGLGGAPRERALPLRLFHRQLRDQGARRARRRAGRRAAPADRRALARQYLPQRIGATGVAGALDVAGLRYRPVARMPTSSCRAGAKPSSRCAWPTAWPRSDCADGRPLVARQPGHCCRTGSLRRRPRLPRIVWPWALAGVLLAAAILLVLAQRHAPRAWP